MNWRKTTFKNREAYRTTFVPTDYICANIIKCLFKDCDLGYDYYEQYNDESKEAFNITIVKNNNCKLNDEMGIKLYDEICLAIEPEEKNRTTKEFAVLQGKLLDIIEKYTNIETNAKENDIKNFINKKKAETEPTCMNCAAMKIGHVARMCDMYYTKNFYCNYWQKKEV